MQRLWTNNISPTDRTCVKSEHIDFSSADFHRVAQNGFSPIVRIIICAVILIGALFSATVNAEQLETYDELLELSGAEGLNESVSNETQEYLKRYNIDVKKLSNLWNINGFELVSDLIKSSLSNNDLFNGVLSAVIIMSIVYVITFLLSDGSMSTFSSFDSMLYAVCALILLVPVSRLALDTANAISTSCVFMTSFIPVYAGALYSTGALSTAGSYSTLMYGTTQIYSIIADVVMIPLSSMMLITSAGAAFNPMMNKLSNFIKRVVLITMSLLATVFVTILSLQTAIAIPADSLGLKTVKTAVGTFVPIVGGMLGETLSILSSSGALLKSGIGIYAIVCLCIMSVPLITRLLIWRIIVSLCSFILNLVEAKKAADMVKNIGGVITVIISIVLGVTASDILSVLIALSVGR